MTTLAAPRHTPRTDTGTAPRILPHDVAPAGGLAPAQLREARWWLVEAGLPASARGPVPTVLARLESWYYGGVAAFAADTARLA